MPDINDVVRHVILRVLVDQAGLGDELAGARAKLKGLQQAEQAANRERVKDNDKVTDAVRRQKTAIEDNRRAHEAAQRATAGKSPADTFKATTAAIAEQTKAIKQQSVEEARAAEIRTRTAERTQRDKDNDRKSNERKDRESTERVERSQTESGQKLLSTQLASEARLAGIKKRNAAQQLADAEKLSREKNKTAEQDLAAEERLRREKSKTAAQQLRDAEATKRAQANTREAIRTENQKLKDAREISGARTDAAQSIAQGAAARTSDAEDRSTFGAAERRAKATRDAATHEAKLAQILQRTTIDMERAAAAAERRQRAGRRGEVLRPLGRAIGSAATIVGRALTTSEVSGANAIDRSRRDRSVLADTERDIVRAESALGRFFQSIQRGVHGARGLFKDLGAGIRAFTSDLAKPLGGGGGNNFGNFFRGMGQFADGLSGKLANLGKGFLSFRGLIVTVLIALGPLAAMLGAVGAGALGLAGNLANLSGVMFALPGILGALVGGFGALALVMKPMSNVFSAFNAAQKQTATNAHEARDALLDHQIALITQRQAALAHQRAIQDEPRAWDALSKARKQASRDIQDYRLALQKLKFDQEGAELGVLSAEQKMRRALADPTANNLDRRIAKHDVQGALFDQRDQKVTGGRLKEDAAEAEKKGVEGSDAVIAGLRGVQDAAMEVVSTYWSWQKAILAAKKAGATDTAGGTAAEKLQAELDKLPPKTRKVAEAFIELQKGPIKAMRDRLSEKIFGPMSGDTSRFTELVKNLETYLGPAADAVGRFADKALSLFTSPDWKKFFAEQGEESGYILNQLGDAALAAAEGFRGITETARPFTRFVVDGILGMAKSFEKFGTSDEGRDKLARFLKVTKKTMTELKPVVVNFAEGIAGFWSALNNTDGANKGTSFISRINGGLLSMAKRFNELGQKAKDPNGGFQKWLRDVGPLLKDVVGFLGDVGRFFGTLFSDKSNITEAQNILKTIGEEILPKISAFFDGLSKSGAISKIVDAFSKIADAVQRMMENGGVTALGTFFAIISKVGGFYDGVVKLAEAIPGLSEALKILGSVVGFLAGAALFAKLTGILAAIRGINKFRDWNRNSGDPTDTRGRGRKVTDFVTGNRPDTELTGTKGILPILRVMEGHLAQIVRLLGGRPTTGGTGDRDGKPRPGGPAGGAGTRPRTRMQRLRDRIRGTTPEGRRPKRQYDIDTDNLPDDQPRRRRATVSGIDSGPSEPIDGRNSPTGRAERRAAVEEARRTRLGMPAVEPDRIGTRGNNRYRSDRLRDLSPDYDEAMVEDRRRSAEADRSNRPSSGRVTPKQRRQQAAQARQTRRERGVSVPGGTPDVPVRRPTGFGTIGDVLTGGGTTRGYGDLGQYGTTVEPRRTRTTTPDTPAPARRRRFGRRGGAAAGGAVAGDLVSDIFNLGSNALDDTLDNLPDRDQPAPRRRGGLFGRIGRAIIAPARGDDAGSIQLAPDRPFRSRRRGLNSSAADPSVSRPRGLPTVGDGDDDYEDGYEDGMRAGQGGQQLPDFDLPDRDDDDRRSRRGLPDDDEDQSRRRRDDLPDIDEDDDRSRRRGRGGRDTTPDADDDRPRRRRRRGGRGRVGGRGRGGALRNLLGRGGRGAGRGLGRVFGGAGRGLGRVFGGAGRGLGRAGGMLARVGGGLARGLAGGVAGLVLGTAASLGAGYLTDKFVKDDEDKASLDRGVGAIATGAGIGATIGSVVPGLGTAIGGAVGGAVGGAYSLYKDKNLRDYVGAKISSGAKATGGALGGVVGGIRDFVSGGGDEKSRDKGGTALGGAALGFLGPLGGMLGGSGIGGKILDSLKKAAGGIGEFFTKTIPGFFSAGVRGITTFFTVTLPGLPKRAINTIAFNLGVLVRFFTTTLPRAASAAWRGISNFFTTTLPRVASAAWRGISNFFTRTLPRAAAAAFNGIRRFILAIPGFFTRTIPRWFRTVNHWVEEHIRKPVRTFITKTIPEFFTHTIPAWFKAAPKWFKTHVVDHVTNFFTISVPEFFTKTLPDAIRQLPGFLYAHLVQPILDFFGGLAGHVGDFLKGTWDWAKSVFSGAGESFDAGKSGKPLKRMSGGLIEGIYQGLEDRVMTLTSPGEFVVRRGMVNQPRGHEFLRDYNEGRFNPADWYAGLTATTSPQVMTTVPASAPFQTSKPQVVNNTVNSGLSIGDITIHNPVRERSEHSLRRQIQIAAIRHKG